MTLSFFTSDGDALAPTDLARSLWSHDQMHGVALSGAMARSLEAAVAELGRPELRPARYTLDLFRAARMQPCRTTTRVVREGRRLCLVDTVLEQGGEPVARASGLFLQPSEPAPGAVWQPDEEFSPPPLEMAPVSEEPRVPLFSSEERGWTTSFGDHQNGQRKMTWQTGMPVVPGEDPSPFVSAASVADATSMVTNWGSGGVEHINTDVTLTLARLPHPRDRPGRRRPGELRGHRGRRRRDVRPPGPRRQRRRLLPGQHPALHRLRRARLLRRPAGGVRGEGFPGRPGKPLVAT